MEYTQEQYQQAIQKAMADGNPEAAKGLAKRASLLYGAAPTPIQQQFPQETATMATAKKENEKFGAEVTERFRNVTGDDPTLLRQLAQVPELGMIIGSQALRAGGATLSTYIGEWIPNAVKEGAEQAFNKVKDTDEFKLAAQAASYGFDAYMKFKEVFPGSAERLESIVDISAMFSPRPDLPRVTAFEVPAKGAEKVAKSLNRAKKKEGVTRLLDPLDPEMRDVFEENGVLRTKTWVPNDFDNEVIETITNIPGVKPNRSYTKNYREIQLATDKAKAATDNLIAAQNKKISFEQLEADMEAVVKEVLSDPMTRAASGDIQNQLKVMTEVALDSIKNYDTADLMGVLEVRRRFDNTIGDFDGSSKAKNIAARKIRNVLNETLKNNTSGDKLHDLLKQQFHGITAMDNMLPKRIAEKKDVISRLVHNLKSVDLLPNTVLALAATGSAGIGMAGGAVPAAVAGALGAAVYAGVQLVNPRKAATAYAQLLRVADQAMKVSTPEVVEQLKIDRLLLVDLLDEARSQIPEEEASE
jgi:hypothetical protein